MEYKNQEQNLFLKFIFRPAAKYCIPLLSSFRVTPNQITLLSFFFGVFATVLFVYSQYFLGSICICIYIFLDVCDGELARFKNECTPLGAKLDFYSNALIWFLLPMGLYLGADISFFLFLLSWMAIAVNQLIIRVICPYTTEYSPQQRVFNRFFVRNKLRFGFDEIDMQLMIVIMAPFENSAVILYSIITLMTLDWIYRVVECREK